MQTFIMKPLSTFAVFIFTEYHLASIIRPFAITVNLTKPATTWDHFNCVSDFTKWRCSWFCVPNYQCPMFSGRIIFTKRLSIRCKHSSKICTSFSICFFFTTSPLCSNLALSSQKFRSDSCWHPHEVAALVNLCASG